MYKAILLFGCVLSAVHAGDWARFLWRKKKRPQATIIFTMCALVLTLAVKAVTIP